MLIKSLKRSSIDELISGILPKDAYFCWGFINEHQGPLYEEELRCISGSVPSRVMEFKAGRTCARRALALLGVGSCPIPIGTGRQPVWPPYIAGSITHDGVYCAATVANRTCISYIGIDLAVLRPVDADVYRLILTDNEISHMKQRSSVIQDELIIFSILFSVKEAIFKCIFPGVLQIFDFRDVELQVGKDGNLLINLLNKKVFGGFGYPMKASYIVCSEFVFSVVWVETGTA